MGKAYDSTLEDENIQKIIKLEYRFKVVRVTYSEKRFADEAMENFRKGSIVSSPTAAYRIDGMTIDFED